MLPIEILLKDHIDPAWSEWLGNLGIHHTEDDQTLLIGSVADQAALFGILRKIRDLDLRLISVVINDPCNSIENE
jgi:hypothetical protein